MISLNRRLIGGMGLALAAAVIVTGCNAPPISGKADVPGPYPNISLSNASLQQAVRFQTPIVSRTANNNMSVVVPLRANSDETLQIEYRVFWYDAGGREIPPQMAWAPLRLEKRQVGQIAAVSTSDQAVDYNVQVRWGKR